MARYAGIVRIDQALIGQDINDLAISPQSPWILASASLDLSVRIWSLDPAHESQPCMLICAGEGHREGLLSLVCFFALSSKSLTVSRLSMPQENTCSQGEWIM